MKYSALLLLQLCWMTSAFASDEEGYIIKNSGDTAWGKIDVQTKKAVFSKRELDLGKVPKNSSQ